MMANCGTQGIFVARQCGVENRLVFSDDVMKEFGRISLFQPGDLLAELFVD